MRWEKTILHIFDDVEEHHMNRDQKNVDHEK